MVPKVNWGFVAVDVMPPPKSHRRLTGSVPSSVDAELLKLTTRGTWPAVTSALGTATGAWLALTVIALVWVSVAPSRSR